MNFLLPMISVGGVRAHFGEAKKKAVTFTCFLELSCEYLYRIGLYIWDGFWSHVGGFLHDIASIFFFPFVFLYLLFFFFWSVLFFLKT